jgi:hypothetical protein
MSREQHIWYNTEEKTYHVDSFFKSGLSLTKYSEENNICRSTLATWIRHYNSANLIANNTFQDVTPIFKQEPQSINSSIKLTLPNGISLEFDSSILHLVIGEFK